MSPATKIGIAAMVVVILLFNPLCICLGTTKATAPPAQSCHSTKSPVKDDGGKPNCFYLDTQMVPIESAQFNAASPHIAAEFNALRIANQLSVIVARTFPVAMFALDDRFITLHQFRI